MPRPGTTRSMRGKEEAHDYRYFPDPDLVPLVICRDWVEQVRAALPELPEAKRQRFISRVWASPPTMPRSSPPSSALADYFEACVAAPAPGQGLRQLGHGRGQPRPQRRRDRHRRLPGDAGAARRSAQAHRRRHHLRQDRQDRLRRRCGKRGKDADAIIDEQGLRQVSDTGAIEAIIDEIIAANPGQVEEYRSGKEKVFGFFVGQVMKASKGKANPAAVNELLKQKLQG